MRRYPTEQIFFCCQSCKAKRRRAACVKKRTSSLPPQGSSAQTAPGVSLDLPQPNPTSLLPKRSKKRRRVGRLSRDSFDLDLQLSSNDSTAAHDLTASQIEIDESSDSGLSRESAAPKANNCAENWVQAIT